MSLLDSLYYPSTFLRNYFYFSLGKWRKFYKFVGKPLFQQQSLYFSRKTLLSAEKRHDQLQQLMKSIFFIISYYRTAYKHISILILKGFNVIIQVALNVPSAQCENTSLNHFDVQCYLSNFCCCNHSNYTEINRFRQYTVSTLCFIILQC